MLWANSVTGTARLKAADYRRCRVIGVAPQHMLCLPNLSSPRNITARRRYGALMSVWQAILFGMMLSWTPSLLILAWVVWKEPVTIEDT